MNILESFSKRHNDIGPASSIQQNELVYDQVDKGLNPIILSYGEAPFEVDAIDFSNIDHARGSHYSQGIGIKEFREEIAGYLKKFHNVDCNSEKNVLVSAGSKIISFYCAQLFLNKGDVMLLHEPSWVSYQEHASFSQADVEFIPYDQDIGEARKYFEKNPRIRIIVLNNPNNPRGYIYSESQLRKLAKDCMECNVILIVDESYSDFCGEKGFFSAGCLVNEFNNVVSMNSISKNFGLSGWRLGYAIASEEIINGLNKFNQHLMTCAPTVLQLALVEKGLINLRYELDPFLADLNKKREKVASLLTKHGFDFLDGSATFYFFIDVGKFNVNTKDFVIKLLKNRHVSIIPGGAYGTSTQGFLRLSFGVESLERIEAGLKILKEELENERS
mgnify:FL=1